MGNKDSKFQQIDQTTGANSLLPEFHAIICNACSKKIISEAKEIHCPQSVFSFDESGKRHIHDKDTCWQKVSCPVCKAITTHFFYRNCPSCDWSSNQSVENLYKQ